MSIQVEIQVQGGKVTITVGDGGKPASSNAADTIVAQGNVVQESEPVAMGGDGLGNPDPGGGRPGAASAGGVVVIGPIVVDGSLLQGASSQSKAGSKGGDGLANPDPGGSDPGAGQSCCGALVIGPIVIGGQCAGTAATPTAKGVAVDPDEKQTGCD